MTSLRARLLTLVAVVLVPTFILIVVLVGRERTARLEAAQSSALQLVEAGVSAQQEAIVDGLRILRAFGMIAAIRSGDAAACGRTLAALSEMVEEAWSVTRTLADGIQDCATRGVTTLPRDVSANPGFAYVRDARTALVGEYMRSTGTGELLLPLNVPITAESGAFAGVLSAGLRLRWFDALSARVLATPGAVVSITVRGDSILRRAPAVERPVLPPSPDHPIAQAMQRDGRGVVDAVGIDGVRRVWAFDRLQSPDSAPVWLTVGLPAVAVYEGVNAQLRTTLLVLVVWLALMIMAAWWAAERFVLRDVRAVLEATARIGSGDLAARTGLRARTGEMARLASSVDEMAARLQERQDRQVQAQKLESIGQLAGGVAHDFNNLLTAIIGNTAIARGELDEAHPARAELDAALEAADRSAALTRQLLAFARRSELAPRVVRADAMLEEVASLLRRIIGEHYALDLVIEPDLALARLDTVSVEQAIVNLVVNARDAMPTGGRVTLEGRTVQVRAGDPEFANGVPAGRWLVVSVHDGGIGMTPDVLARAFEPFFTTKPVGQGTGLGLAMVYGTVVQHSGHVLVDSTPGRGTEVRLFFPPAPEGATPEPLHQEPPVAPISAALRVLLVEDEDAVRRVVERVLHQQQYDVLSAVDGEQALALCDEATLASVDVVISDVVMPRLGGVELVTALRARRRDLPVLFVSGYRETNALDTLLATPHTAFLEKPFAPASLLQAVQLLLAEDAVPAR